MTDSARLPLARLLLVGALVPAVYSSLDHWLLTRLQLRPNDTGHIVLTMAVFAAQVGLLGWLCGRLLDDPWWRWGLYIWGWVLVDLQLLSATVFADGGNWRSHGRLLPGSMFAAQVGLTIIWAILGTTRWTLRWPTCLVLGTVLAVPALEGRHFSSEILFPAQMIALAGLCLLLRWQRFQLQRIDVQSPTAPTPGSPAAKQLQLAQFSIRHVLIWTTSLAVVLGVLRALDLLSIRALLPYFEGSAISSLTAGILIAGVFVVAVWAALGAGPAWLRWPMLIASLVLCGLSFCLLHFLSNGGLWSDIPTLIFHPGTPTRSSWYWERDRWLAAWVILAGGLLFASLIILRVLGYRLARTAKPRPVVGVNGV